MARGIVVSFDLRKGFGFIRSPESREDVFVHVTAVDGKVALRPGQRVEFVAEPTEKGPRATRVVPGRAGLSPTMSAAVLLIAVLLGVTGGLHKAGLGWMAAYLGAIWLATWLAYARDKRRAGLGERRVPEAALLGLALIGGSPSAMMAMLVLRHKTRKPAFLIPFALIVLAQALAIAAWLNWR